MDSKEIRKAERRIRAGSTDGMNCSVCGGPLMGAEGGRPSPEEVILNRHPECGGAALTMSRITREIMETIVERDRDIRPFCDITIKVQDGKPVLVEILTKHKPSNAARDTSRMDAYSDGRKAGWMSAADVRKLEWLNPSTWDRCGQEWHGDDELKSRACVGGLDTSSNTGIVAFILYFPANRKDQKAAILPYFWIPGDNIDHIAKSLHWPVKEWLEAGYMFATPGSAEDPNWIKESILPSILQLHQGYRITDVGVDPWNSAQIATALEGVTVTEVRQGITMLAPAVTELERLVRSGQLSHGGNPVLRAMMEGLALREDENGNRRPDKPRSATPISGMIALLNAMAIALVQTSPVDRPDPRRRLEFK